MALSYYSNWDTTTTTTSCFPQPQLELPMPMDFTSIHENFTYAHGFIDPNHSFLSQNYSHFFDNSTVSLSPLPDLLFPKRQKIHENHYYDYHHHDAEWLELVTPCLVDEFVPNPPLLPEFSGGVNQFPLPVDFDYGSWCVDDSVVVKKKGSGGTAQSIAARQRRRKITEKTQELGKLIPGAHKMNTAEMFQAAFKYIHYLRAQVGVLQTMASIQSNEEALYSQELQALATSPSIQEKLYSSENCLVPKQFGQTLANDGELQSNSLEGS